MDQSSNRRRVFLLAEKRLEVFRERCSSVFQAPVPGRTGVGSLVQVACLPTTYVFISTVALLAK